MLKSLSFSIIILLVYRFKQVHSAGLSMVFKLSDNKIELNCSAVLGKGEQLKHLALSKDGAIFLEYDKGQEKKPKFIGIPGITLTTLNGGCDIVIFNYIIPDKVLFEVRIKYTGKDGKERNARKKYQASMKYAKCKPSWVDMKKDDKVPTGAFAAALRKNGDILRVCHTGTNTEEETVGYFASGRGCVYTMAGNIEEAPEFQILKGTGFSWAIQVGDEAIPKAFKVGSDWTGEMHLGRGNTDGSAFIGKITNNFYYDKSGKETSDMKTHGILVCA